MKPRIFLVLAIFYFSSLAACGDDSDPPCSCIAGEIPPSCAWECSAPENDPENVGEAESKLTVAASRVFQVSSLYYGTDNCQHGAIATDAAARCNSPTETVFARFQNVPACTPATATLGFQRMQWHDVTTLDVRRVLRPVIDPPVGVSSACSDSFPGAKWDSTGTVPWSVLGAKGWGTDASTEKVSVAIPVDGTLTVIRDLALPDGGTLVDDCAPTGECMLGFYPDHHVWEYPGTFVLSLTCASPPPVCGDGVIEGAEGCDDGNAADDDGCSAGCVAESGYACSGAPSDCDATCGDGIVAGLEECDDGNLNEADACAGCVTQNCTLVCE